MEAGVEPVCPLGADVLWRAGESPQASCDCSECGGEIECDLVLGYGVFGFCPEELFDSGCQPFSTQLTGQLSTSFSLGVAPGSACESPGPGEPGFREQAVGCAPAAEPCEGGVCLPGPACISQEGDRPCPPSYPDRSLLHATVSGDELSCDTCGCGDGASGLFCTEAVVALYDSENCAGAPMSTPQPYDQKDACAGYVNTSGITLIEDVVSIDIQIPAADCSSDRGIENAAGDFVESDPRTVCCAG